ncbi:hypothetical protein ACJ41O_008937 [Fusarium nematophilum]
MEMAPSLIRDTRAAARIAAKAWLSGAFATGPGMKAWELTLPSKAEVMTCRHLHPDGGVDGTLAGCLATCNRADLLEIKPQSSLPVGFVVGEKPATVTLPNGSKLSYAEWRMGGDKKTKVWEEDDAVRVAFVEFRLRGLDCDFSTKQRDANHPLSKVLDKVLREISLHFAHPDSAKPLVHSPLVSSTRGAVLNARGARLREKPWESKLPAKEKVLACRFVDPVGNVDEHLAGWLAELGRTDLLDLRSY